ncbi:putative ribonuclease III [Helianthus annuus]|nr:putative ribonuclease III [Helianthus annuus]KAJ0459435.1 putative ribonuclease III [Helianthus annuus]KAJ0639964.1 putative ribonuclease III [Helianthus annuus]KAJ0643916.1 putative ribonuclease III [Helianthus annuus]
MNDSITESNLPLLPSLNEVETIIGYNFKNKELLKEAFTHNSFKDNESQVSYERLEYLGDSVLNLMFAKQHYFSYPKMNSGELTRLRAANVDTEALARVAFKHGLHRFLRHEDPSLNERVQELMEGIKEHPLHSHGLINSPKILADIVEAVVGAVYVDTGLSIDDTWEVNPMASSGIFLALGLVVYHYILNYFSLFRVRSGIIKRYIKSTDISNT